MPSSLSVDLYELTMAQSYFRFRPRASATFDLFVRDLPARRSFLLACGLEDAVGYIRDFRFSSEEIGYLRRLKLFSADFLAYLARLRFTGDLWALPEGTVFFPNEPVIRLTAPIIEAQIFETALLNTIHLPTLIASKAARIVQAAGSCGVFDFSLRRTHGEEAGLKAARAAYIAGAQGTSNCLAGARYGIPVAGTMAHSFVMAFAAELDSFLAYSMSFPRHSILLVDTYDTVRGIANAVTIGLYLKQKGYCLAGIRLDSGALVSLSRTARRMLDKAGLEHTRIFASGNLDEYKIGRIVASGAPIDSFGVGTNMGTSSDAPSLDVIYKLSEVTDEKGSFSPAMKLSSGKVTHPGRKQVFRSYGRNGIMVRDTLGLAAEKLPGEPLLKKIFSSGRLVYRLPPLARIRSAAQASVRAVPARLRKLSCSSGYPVGISSRLRRLSRSVRRELESQRK